MITHKAIRKLPKSAIELTITVNEQSLAEEFATVLQTFAKNAQIPGFRKGHTPKKVLQKKFNSAIALETKQNILDKALKAVFEGKENDFPLPYSQPRLASANEIELGSPFTFTVMYDTFPNCSIADYTGEIIDTYTVEIQDNDLDAELQKYQKQNSVLLEKKPPLVALGDVITFDYVLVDNADKDIAETKHTGFVCTVGENQDTYNIATELAGMSAGETTIIEKEYPEDYQDSGLVDGKNPDLAGSKKRIKATIQEVKTLSVPAIDDELAQDISERFNTLDDLKTDIKKKLERSTDNLLRRFHEQQIMHFLVKNTFVDIPESMLAAEMNAMLQNIAQNYGKEPDEMLALLRAEGSDALQSLLASLRPQAENTVKRSIIMGRLIEQFSITADDNTLKSFIAEQMPPDTDIDKTIEEYKTNNTLEGLRYTVMEQEVYTHLLQNLKKDNKGILSFTELQKALHAYSEKIYKEEQSTEHTDAAAEESSAGLQTQKKAQKEKKHEHTKQ